MKPTEQETERLLKLGRATMRLLTAKDPEPVAAMAQWQEEIRAAFGAVESHGIRPDSGEANDSERLAWCVCRAAQVFDRQTPEPMIQLVWWPNGADGWIAGEVERKPIPAEGIVLRLADYGGIWGEAVRAAIDMARSGRVPEGA